MKILWINDEARFAGGAETYIYQTAQALKSHYGVDNILFYNVENRVEPKFAEVFSFVTVMADLKTQIELNQPDLIYVHQVNNPEVLKTLSDLDIPVVGFIHDHKYFCLREHKYTTLSHTTCTQSIGLGCYGCLGFLNKSSSFPHLSINTLTRLKSVHVSLKKFDHMVVASEYMKQHLVDHGFDPSRIAKIQLFSEPSKQPLSKLFSGEAEKRLLFVGQLIRGKGVDTLLHAFAELRDKHSFLDICGEGKQREELEQLAHKLGVADRVIFHGKVALDALSDFYAASFAVVVPSRAPETFNLVGLEAMKHAKAVIAADVGGIREWLREGVTGWTFPSNDTQKLLQRLEHSVKNPSEIRLMGMQGLRDYQQTFQPIQHCRAMHTLFTTITKDTYAI